MKLKKTLKIVAIALPILIIVLLVAVYFAFNTMVKKGMENGMPIVTGTPVDVESVNIGMFTGSGSIKGLFIRNPEGFKTKSAFEMGQIDVDVNVGSVRTDTVVIKKIHIKDPKITLELGLTSTNLGTIKKHIDKLAAADEEKPASEQGKKIVIDSFVIEGAKIGLSAKFLQGRQANIPLPTIRLKDIGKEKPMTRAQVAKAMFDPLLDAINKAIDGAGKLLGDGYGAVKKGLGGAWKGGSEGGRKALDAGEKAVDKGKDGLKKVGDGIKGLFKKDEE